MSKMDDMTVQSSDLLKIFDALKGANTFLKRRDEMNAAVHMGREVRYSPLTVSVMAECDRLRTLLSDAGINADGQ